MKLISITYFFCFTQYVLSASFIVSHLRICRKNQKRFSTKKTDVFPEIQTYLYEQLPIPSVSKETQSRIIEIVNEILLTKSKNPNAATLSQEATIDIIIFKLFDLTYEEVLSIDNTISFTRQEYEE